MSKGIIYILTNEAMPGYVKIGKTINPVDRRMRELDTTGIPVPFECFYAGEVRNMDETERLLHFAFGEFRVRDRREFFRVSPERVVSALMLAGPEDVTPRDEVVEDEGDLKALDYARARSSNFNFSMVRIEPGAKLSFSKDPSSTCIVVDEKRVEFEGEVTSLSSAALEIDHRLGYTRTSACGPREWEYEGEILSARRARMEEGSS